MPYTLTEDANAVLFPAFDSVTLSDSVLHFLERGGVSILLGESRSEYVAREMSQSRVAEERIETIQGVTSQARKHSDLLLVAVDQELGGICRLHGLVPAFPLKCDIANSTPSEIEATAREVAKVATKMGINLFLAPILDVLDGTNQWLEGRVWSNDPYTVSTLTSAYIRGVQEEGIAATAKHFPGFRSITADPAIDSTAITLTSLSAIEEGLLPFQAAIESNVDVVMVGPAIVKAMDPERAALRSPIVINYLKHKMGFSGVIMADDLDSQATMRGDSVTDVAIDALNAGCDFLLLADTGTQLEEVANAIEVAARSGKISAEKLAISAEKVRSLARKRAL